jgi:5'-3' exoribonuclease 1
MDLSLIFSSMPHLVHQDAMIASGEPVKAGEVFDSNCITPGTEFMAALSEHLRYFVRMKVRDDASWQRVRVIFSGHEVRLADLRADLLLLLLLLNLDPHSISLFHLDQLREFQVPGEGEHKIMQYIRAMKMQPNYDPNLRHCLYGTQIAPLTILLKTESIL